HIPVNTVLAVRLRMIDADIENGVLTSDNIHVVSRIPEPVRKSPVKTLEEKLMECPVWATW
ncbi:TPA: hypothetical protein ACRX0L_005657, partial [Klebsiella pneumoniae]